MKKMLLTILLIGSSWTFAQIINQRFNSNNNNFNYTTHQQEIETDGYVTNLTAKVIYNVLPDGYHITFTKSYIAKSNDEVEQILEKSMHDLGQDLKKHGVQKEEIVIDVLSLDPLFDTSLRDSSSIAPIGFKLVQNITINAANIEELRPIVTTCLNHKIYDIIDIKAYIKNTKVLYDSLKQKSLEIINYKKELCEGLGYSFSGGKASFKNYKQVIYPNERYLKSYVTSTSLYKHHLSESSDINIQRELDIDNYYTLDLKSADFIFNSEITKPVIQVYYQIDYAYTKKNEEAIAAAKEEAEAFKNRERVYFIVNDEGELERLDLKGARKRK